MLRLDLVDNLNLGGLTASYCAGDPIKICFWVLILEHINPH
jgi:hypothetical protein